MFVTDKNTILYYNDEYFDMMMALGECDIIHSQRYPDREQHSHTVFQRLAGSVRETRKVQPTHNKNQQITRPAHDDV